MYNTKMHSSFSLIFLPSLSLSLLTISVCSKSSYFVEVLRILFPRTLPLPIPPPSATPTLVVEVADVVTAVVYAVGVAVIEPVPVTRVGGVARLAPPTERGEAEVMPSVFTRS